MLRLIKSWLKAYRSGPSLEDQVSEVGALTEYDKQHLTIYARLLDAEKNGADWTEAAHIVLRLDPEKPDTRQIWERHLSRAKWVKQHHLSVLQEKSSADCS